MASVSPDALLRLLLDRLDAEQAPVLSGIEVARYPAAERDHLVELRLVTETAQLDELGPCECGTDGCYQTVHRDTGGLWAVCPSASLKPRAIAEDEIRQFRIEVGNFHERLREANRLDGDAITEFTRTICFLGRASVAGRKVPVVLARCLSARSAESARFEIRGRLSDKPLFILTPTPRALDLHTQHHLKADGLVLVSLADSLLEADRIALDRQALESLLRPEEATGVSTAALRIDIGRSLCCFRSANVTLAKRPFDVLVLLAKEAQCGPGWASRDRIFETCWREDWERGVAPNEEQITKMVSEVRKGFRIATRLSDREARSLVVSKSKTGYRLNLRPDEIEVI